MSYTKTQWNNDTAPAINETNLNKIEQGIYDNDSHIGDLSDLETTTNTDLVSAINENVDNIGDLTTLTTTANTDLVSAINELESEKQDNLTAGNNIQISNNVISATDTTYSVATTSANGLMSSADKSKLNSINDAVSIGQSLTSNIGSAYWANQINYIVLGKVAFCYVIINLRTKDQTTLNEEAYIEMPFTFKSNWFFPLMKANYSGTQDIFIQGANGSNRLYLVKNSNRDRYKVSELPNTGYIVDIQFFALLE